MKNCRFCGAYLADTDVFCANCGRSQADEPQQFTPPAGTPAGAAPTGAAPSPSGVSPAGVTPAPGYGSPYYMPPVFTSYAPKATGYFVWSIILAVFSFSRLFGMLGIVFSQQAKHAKTQAEANDNMRAVKIVCIAGTVMAALTVVFFIVYFVFIFASIQHSLEYMRYMG